MSVWLSVHFVVQDLCAAVMAIPVQTKFTQITHTPRWRDFNMSGLARKGPKHPGGFNEAKLHCRAGRSWARAAGLLLAAGATTYCAPWSWAHQSAVDTLQQISWLQSFLSHFHTISWCLADKLAADRWWGVWRSVWVSRDASRAIAGPFNISLQMRMFRESRYVQNAAVLDLLPLRWFKILLSESRHCAGFWL